jgi:endonuclease G, mitochondrial
MKQLIAILMAMGVAAGYAQTRSVQTPWYQVEYDEALESPVTITYQVECTETTISRKGMDFRRVDSIHTSDAADYRNNVWDKGHMAPAAAFACDQEALRATFLYVNCALQHESLNRGAWRQLEAWERKQAESGVPVTVRILVEWVGAQDTLATGAVVPTHFSKWVTCNGVTTGFRFPNSAVGGAVFWRFEQH